MEDEMIKFRHNADRLGLCEEFSQRWSDCKSKKQLYDLACNVNSLSYLAEMIAKGYGLTPEYLVSEFGQFFNGKCVYNGNGYSSCIYCRPPEDKIEIATTAALIIDFDGVVKVDRPCELYIVNSKVMIVGTGIPQIYAYNSEVEHPNMPIKVMENKKY